MTQYTIEKGIPLPCKTDKFPFHLMEIGDSFLIREDQKKSCSTLACLYARKHPGVKFSVRSVEGGARVWRVS